MMKPLLEEAARDTEVTMETIKVRKSDTDRNVGAMKKNHLVIIPSTETPFLFSVVQMQFAIYRYNAVIAEGVRIVCLCEPAKSLNFGNDLYSALPERYSDCRGDPEICAGRRG